MNYAGRGVHSITINVQIGDTIDYKYYVNGWGEDSWKTDAPDGESNGSVTISSCGQEFGNKTGSDVVNPGGSDTPVQPDVCKATFYYTNPYTRVETGGEQDWDVYLVGSFNIENDAWVTPDPDYKMEYVGRGVHANSIDV
ncbi:MAG: hypothetical protein J6S69_07465, partial [Proteobacteria bacterium]|nr:hypothetical protein [Pseudomonadota bacterium]